MRSRAVIYCLILAFTLLAAVLPSALVSVDASAADQSKLSELQRKIQTTRAKVGRRKGTEKVLTGDIARWSKRIAQLQGSIRELRERQQRLEADLERKRDALDKTQTELRKQRARITRLRSRLAKARELLARRLVELYTSDQPDLISVVLSSNGFADLLERGEFLARIQQQDGEVIGLVADAKREATDTTRRLARLERDQHELTAAVKARRDQVGAVKRRLISTRVGYQRTRADKTVALKSVKANRQELEHSLAKLEQESAKIQARLSVASQIPIKQGSGRFIWPVTGTLTAPFCERRSWESCHPGIDIGAATGTPIHAADAGTVRIAAPTGGYGNFTCIAHSASLTTCYGHQSSIGVSVGQSVDKGQVIGAVGSTGFSTGPHLHFEVRVGGAVRNPMNYL